MAIRKPAKGNWGDGDPSYRSEPTSGKKLLGWIRKERPSFRWFNWLTWHVYETLSWIYDFQTDFYIVGTNGDYADINEAIADGVTRISLSSNIVVDAEQDISLDDVLLKTNGYTIATTDDAISGAVLKISGNRFYAHGIVKVTANNTTGNTTHGIQVTGKEAVFRSKVEELGAGTLDNGLTVDLNCEYCKIYCLFGSGDITTKLNDSSISYTNIIEYIDTYVNKSISINEISLIQDYTTVKNVGDADQQVCLRDWTKTELEARFGVGNIKAYHRFGAGGALVTDEIGAYNLTLLGGAKDPANCAGIVGTNFGVSFDGGDVMSQATLLDDMNTTYSGAGKGFIHSFVMEAPTDGQPAADSYLFFKRNSAANDTYQVYLSTTGKLAVDIRGNSATTKTLNPISVSPNGANTNFVHCVFTWNTATGASLFLNRTREANDPTATTLMVDGTTTDFLLGGKDTTPIGAYTGKIFNSIIIQGIPTASDLDWLYAVSIPLPTVLQGQNFEVCGRYKNLGVDVRNFNPEIVAIETTRMLLRGNYGWQATDERKLYGRI